MNHRRKLLTLVLLAVLILAVPGVVQADTPASPSLPVGPDEQLGPAFTYQGYLKDGNSPAEGSYDLIFDLYDAEEDGNLLGSLTQEDVTVVDGYFTITLNYGTGVFDGQARWLEIRVRPGAETGAFTLLTPRQAITAAPYAAYAQTVGEHSHWGATWSGSGTGMTLSGDDTGLSASGDNYGLVGINPSSNSNVAAVFGYASSPTGYTNGVWGQSDSSTAGTGVFGFAAAANGDTYGIVGLVSSPDGYAGYFISGVGNGVKISAPAGKIGLNVESGQALVAGNTIWHAGNDGAGSGLDADLLDGLHASDIQQHYANVIVVAKSGGDYDNITAALNSINDASDTNRYLVRVMPGIYTEKVTMKQYVDIEGSGELSTRITFTGSVSSNTGTVVGTNDAELRFLAVENTGGNTYAIAIHNNTASPHLTHVTASASGGAYSYGVYNASSSPTMTNMAVNASGSSYSYGVYNSSSSPTMMMNVTASASGGTNNIGVSNTSSSPTMMMNVTASASGGTNSYGVFNSSSSPTMTNVTASASGGANSYGVYNLSSSPTMTNVTASASGGANSYGVYNASSSPIMINVTASASGGSTNNIGVYNLSSSPTLHNCTLHASGGTSAFGIRNSATGGSYTVRVDNSQVSGSTNTIYNESEFSTLVGATLLDGGAVAPNGGTVTCAGVYNESYTFYASTCP